MIRPGGKAAFVQLVQRQKGGPPNLRPLQILNGSRGIQIIVGHNALQARSRRHLKSRRVARCHVAKLCNGSVKALQHLPLDSRANRLHRPAVSGLVLGSPHAPVALGKLSLQPLHLSFRLRDLPTKSQAQAFQVITVVLHAHGLTVQGSHFHFQLLRLMIEACQGVKCLFDAGGKLLPFQIGAPRGIK